MQHVAGRALEGLRKPQRGMQRGMQRALRAGGFTSSVVCSESSCCACCWPKAPSSNASLSPWAAISCRWKERQAENKIRLTICAALGLGQSQENSAPHPHAGKHVSCHRRWLALGWAAGGRPQPRLCRPRVALPQLVVCRLAALHAAQQRGACVGCCCCRHTMQDTAACTDALHSSPQCSPQCSPRTGDLAAPAWRTARCAARCADSSFLRSSASWRCRFRRSPSGLHSCGRWYCGEA